jgi:CHAT domain-containing protein
VIYLPKMFRIDEKLEFKSDNSTTMTNNIPDPIAVYACTPSILASLWKVDDYYTSKLMVAFYRALKQTDKLEVLQAARKTMMEDYGKRHPYYWSGFVLIGDYR